MNNIMIIKVIYKVKLYKNYVDISCVAELESELPVCKFKF